MIPDERTDDELLSGLRSGDEQAFVTLYRRRQGAIYRFARHMSGSASLAEDITQEVFLTVIRGAAGYDPARGTFSGYLFGIARKLLLRNGEREARDVPVDEGDGGCLPELRVADDPLAEMTRRERLETLARAVSSLPPRYREAIVLCDLEELDYADAAAALGCPVGTVRSRLHRARALLLEKLAGRPKAEPPLVDWRPVRDW
jgi:RNA polymerase sigma-70 factor (ECF subfamily)